MAKTSKSDCDEESWRCETCKGAYMTREKFLAHLQKEHGVPPDAKGQKNLMARIYGWKIGDVFAVQIVDVPQRPLRSLR